MNTMEMVCEASSLIAGPEDEVTALTVRPDGRPASGIWIDVASTAALDRLLQVLRGDSAEAAATYRTTSTYDDRLPVTSAWGDRHGIYVSVTHAEPRTTNGDRS